MRFLPLVFLILLTGCVPGTPGAGGKSVAMPENPITGGAISVTTLAAPGAKGPAEPALRPLARPKPGPDQAADTPLAPKADTTAGAGEDAPVASVVMTAEEKTCVKSGGSWAKAGKSSAKTCIRRTKDGGKRCDAEQDCEGYCLARSGTCAPAIPMFGCNDILQDNGVQVTLCID